MGSDLFFKKTLEIFQLARFFRRFSGYLRRVRNSLPKTDSSVTKSFQGYVFKISVSNSQPFTLINCTLGRYQQCGGSSGTMAVGATSIFHAHSAKSEAERGGFAVARFTPKFDTLDLWIPPNSTKQFQLSYTL